MRRVYLGLFFLLLVATVVFVGCGGGSSTSNFNQNQQSATSGTVFVIGTDAPLPAVLAFQVTLNSLTLSNGSSSVSVLSEPGTVEFSRLLGLRTLLALNTIPAGTYTSATVTVSSPVISFLDMSTTPPKVTTMNGSLAQTQVPITLPLNPALVVGDKGVGGLHLHFDLRNSLFTNVAGDITGQVTPSIQLKSLRVTDDDALIDELRGGVSSVNVACNSFVVQRPHGRDITIKVDSNTRWQGSDGLSTIAPPCMVEVSGRIQADGSLLATEVEVITRDHAVIGGMILNVNPASGPADTVTMLVNEEMPDITGIDVGKTTTFPVTSQTRFDIRLFDLPVQAFLFNQSMLVVGQRVAAGGVINTTTNPQTLDVRRVVLRRQGVDGAFVSGSVVINGNDGSFSILNNGLFGYILGGAQLKVITSNTTKFVNVNRLVGLQGLTSARLRVVGLLLKDGSGQPVLVAGYVEKLN